MALKVLILRKKIEPLQGELEQLRTDFAANVSHEMKTPLTSIKGFVETLQAGAIDNPTMARKFLDIIMIEADRLTRLINDILSITKLESGDEEVEIKPIALDKAVMEVCELLKIHAQEKEVRLIAAPNEKPAYVMGNPDRVKQLLINLIENGIKYNKTGGSVSIKVFEDKANVNLIIADTGIGIKEEHLRLRDHEPAELAFYSRATTDIEYAFPFTDWGELWGIADRTDYDLGRHQEASGKDLTYFDQDTGEHYIPYVIEPSLGCDRVALAFLCEAYDEEVVGKDKKGNDDIRTVLHLHPALAPYKCAILPLSKKEILTGPAMELYNELSKEFMVDYDETGSIGKRYRREDEIGTPYCITVDFATVGDDKTPADNAVTIRERDSMEQVRVPISELKNWLAEHTKF